VYTLHKTASNGGRVTIILPTRVRGRALKLGQYRLVVTPTLPGAAPGAPRSLNLVLVRL
jgi:hypothetical protein